MLALLVRNTPVSLLETVLLRLSSLPLDIKEERPGIFCCADNHLFFFEHPLSRVGFSPHDFSFQVLPYFLLFPTN